ncbi:ankyrin [Acephala macrosclerotiorum]|nr:ankyrin [Acephala macrosclerotiorum]
MKNFVRVILATLDPFTSAVENIDESWKEIQKAVIASDLDTFTHIFLTRPWCIHPDIIKEGNAIHVRQRGWSYEQRIKCLLGIAAKHKQLQILKYLTAQPIVEDILHQRPRFLETYEMISWAVQGGSPECVSVLLELNRDLVHCRAPHHMHDTPLLDAMRLKHSECLPMTKLLLSCGADPNARSVMLDAYGLQRPEVFTLLEEAGGNTKLFEGDMVNEQTICLAAGAGKIAMVENLIAKGVDVNATYLHGNQYHRGPALCTAIKGNRREIVAVLVAAGANPGIANCLGETSIQLAKQKGEEGKEMLTLFESAVNECSWKE